MNIESCLISSFFLVICPQNGVILIEKNYLDHFTFSAKCDIIFLAALFVGPHNLCEFLAMR